MILFGLVLPEPEALMEPWLREVDKALGDEDIVETVMTVMRRRLEREVTGSLVYRRFCWIDAGKVPDAKTRVCLGQVVDGPTLRELLHRPVTIATAVGVTRRRRMRVDTTVVEAPSHYPTESGLCEDVICGSAAR